MAEFKTEKRTITPRKQTFKKEDERPKTREAQRVEALSPHLMIMVKAVRRAGRSMVRDFGEIASLQMSAATPETFVANADSYAEKNLIEALAADRPDYGFISERTGVVAPQNGSTYTWVLDPIDGKRNFEHGIAEFSISVALMDNAEVVAGVVYNPITNDLYYAEKGQGSFLMTPTGNQRLRVSGRNWLNHALISCNDSGLFRKTAILEKVASVRYNGCTALALASVAAGRYEGFISNKFKIWHVAAGVLLVKEAGGSVCDFAGVYATPLHTLIEKQEIAASNAALKKEVAALVH